MTRNVYEFKREYEFDQTLRGVHDKLEAEYDKRRKMKQRLADLAAIGVTFDQR